MDTADRLLAEAEAIDIAAANLSIESNRVRLPFAAATRAARGSLASIRNDERQAAKHYAAATRSLSFRDTAGRWQLSMAEGRLLLRLGRKQNDPLIVTEAVAAFKTAVALLDQSTPEHQRAETNLALAEALIAAGRLVNDTIGDIQAAGFLETAIALFAAGGRQREQGATEIMLGQCLDRLGHARSDSRLLSEAAHYLEAGLERGGAANATDHAVVTRSLGATLYLLAEIEPSPANFTRAANALDRIESDADAPGSRPFSQDDTTLLAIKRATARARAGAGMGDVAMIRRGAALLTAIIDPAGDGAASQLQLAARLSLAEAMSAIGEHDKAAAPYEEAAIIYADIVADTNGQSSSLIAAHAYSGLADALRATAALTGNTERLTDAISAKRKAHDIFEKAGHGPFVAKMERDLRAIYDLAHLLGTHGGIAKSA